MKIRSSSLHGRKLCRFITSPNFCASKTISKLFTVLGYLKDSTKCTVNALCALVYFCEINEIIHFELFVYFWSHVHKLSFQATHLIGLLFWYPHLPPGWVNMEFSRGKLLKLRISLGYSKRNWNSLGVKL